MDKVISDGQVERIVIDLSFVEGALAVVGSPQARANIRRAITTLEELPPAPDAGEAVAIRNAALDEAAKIAGANFIYGHSIAGPGFADACAQRILALKFAPPPSPPPEDVAGLLAEVGRLQAKIDALMLEHCPDEMTPEHLANWGKHQRCSTPEQEGAVDAAMASPTFPTCIDCGRICPVETVLPNDQWARICPAGGELCPSCIVARAHEIGPCNASLTLEFAAALRGAGG